MAKDWQRIIAQKSFFHPTPPHPRPCPPHTYTRSNGPTLRIENKSMTHSLFEKVPMRSWKFFMRPNLKMSIWLLRSKWIEKHKQIFWSCSSSVYLIDLNQTVCIFLYTLILKFVNICLCLLKHYYYLNAHRLSFDIEIFHKMSAPKIFSFLFVYSTVLFLIYLCKHLLIII